jgi:hypothetical protein
MMEGVVLASTRLRECKHFSQSSVRPSSGLQLLHRVAGMLKPTPSSLRNFCSKFVWNLHSQCAQ